MEILECGHVESKFGRDENGNRYCYACCAERDRADMIATGRATLYLIEREHSPLAMGGDRSGHAVTNWPGSLEFFTGPVRKGRHNIAGTRYDAWFTGPDGKTWHAVQYGQNTQIAHCKRLKA